MMDGRLEIDNDSGLDIDKIKIGHYQIIITMADGEHRRYAYME